ncbi:MAG: hypothetical protein F6K39_16430 [Okeania sp. SIO3B3]|nr:hypothetical protein [Okeania sp. SIO3B3]
MAASPIAGKKWNLEVIFLYVNYILLSFHSNSTAIAHLSVHLSVHLLIQIVHFLFNSTAQLISCSVEYLHFGGRKAAMLFAQHSAGKAEGKKRLKGIKFFYN